jgi:hypothetical protein
MTKKVNLVAIVYAVVIIMVSILLGSCGSAKNCHCKCDAYSQINTNNQNDVASK